MVNKAGSSNGKNYQHKRLRNAEDPQITSHMLGDHDDRGGDSDIDSINEKDHIWQDVDLNGSFDDGLGDFRTPGVCTFRRNETNIYQYRGVYHKSPLQYVPRKGVSRYGNALKTLIPVRRQNKQKERLGVDEAGFLSFVTFSWLSKFMYRAYSKGLTLDDIPEGSPYDSCDYNAQRLESYWNEEVASKGAVDASLGNVVWKFIRTRVLMSSLVFAFNLLTGFISVTICLRSLIQFAERPDAPMSEGIKWAVLLTVAEIFRTIFYSTTWAISYRTAARLRSACLALLYKKVIRLNSMGDNSIGQLINLFANDSQRVFDMVLFGPMIMGGPITITFAIVYILWLLGPWALLGMVIFTVFYPIQYCMSRCTGYFRAKTLAVGDTRIRLVSEILDCIKLIKMYAWEKTFCKDLLQIRQKEMHLLHVTAYCQSLTMSLATTVPIISAIATFLAHIAAGNNLTASEAFSVQGFCLRQLRSVLSNIKEGWKSFVDGNIGLSRVKKVLLLEEIKTSIGRPMDRTQAVCIADGSFSHASNLPEYVKKKNSNKKVKMNLKENGKQQIVIDKTNEIDKETKHFENNEETIVLRNINFSAPKGHLIGVCGHVGSGKTSLLQACLGQLKVVTGRVFREGSCAFVSQQAWILNATFKENVLFGEKFEPQSYWKVINACSLNDDINSLVGGDETEIGERGVNLSGGQKQRVALARALYADRDIYFLDDPLSAVDANVGAHIFNHYILNALKNKTVIFVTHQIQFLNRCNEIYVMKDGQIIEKGSHEYLLSLNGDYASMVKTREQGQCESEQSNSGNIQDLDQEKSLNHINLVNSKDVLNPIKDLEGKGDSPKKHPNGNSAEQSGALTVKEHMEKGSLNKDTYLNYMRAAGGFGISLFIILIMFFNVGTLAFSSWWLALWIKDGSGGTYKQVGNDSVLSTNLADNPNFYMYRGVYAGTVAIIVVSNLIRGFAFTKITLRASKTLHNQLFQKVMYSPMLFFEQTPIGRVQNLFSKDVDEVDARLPVTLESMLQDGWSLIFAILFICLVFQWFIIPLTILLIVYYCISKIFRVAVRDLKRFENATRSPIFSSIAETVQGLDTIHAFGKEADFIRKFTKIFDQNTTCLYMCCIAMRWLSLRIDTLSVMITSITASLVIIFHGQVPPALAGLAVAYSSTISGIFQYTIRLIAEAETRFISVERMTSYLQTLQREGGIGPRDNPPEHWPNQGSIKFNNVNLQYRVGSPLVLKNVTFKIQPGEKIGIVGRTGSGKSSLTVALFRLVELCGGSIKIDNVDISTLELEDLRSQLSIIPQDPVLFTGTVRSNLDPFGQSNDAELWQVLEKTHLKERISLGKAGLDSEVGLSGDKLSVGERQLLCLARALLRKSKILVLDEATAAVDPDTESAVQTTIGTEFQDCTVLTIAHRLATVTSCNRIIIMDNGRVAEIDTPGALLDNPNSKFSQMMEAAKEATDIQQAS